MWEKHDEVFGTLCDGGKETEKRREGNKETSVKHS